MTGSVQGSAQTIGTAPPSAGVGATDAGPLPSLTDQTAMSAPAGTAGDPIAAAAAAPATAGTSAVAPTGTGGLAGSIQWLGPLMAIGGGAAAYKGITGGLAQAAQGVRISGGNSMLKWAGLVAAVGGIGLTALGFKAKGAEEGKAAKEAELLPQVEQFVTGAEQQMLALQNEANTTISTLQQQLAAAQQTTAAGADQTTAAQTAQANPNAQTGSVDPSTGMPSASTAPIVELPTDPALSSTGGVPSSTTGVPGAPGTVSTSTTAAPSTTGVASTGFDPNALVGVAVPLPAGLSAAGTEISAAGSFRIAQVLGDAAGYATRDEANAAVRASISTETMGSKFLRWVVIENNGRFYGAIAKPPTGGEQAVPLTAQHGSVVAWNGLNHIYDGGNASTGGWTAYSWTKDGGATAISIPYGQTKPFPEAAPTGTASTGTAPTGTAPSVTGGGPAGVALPFDPASAVGDTFAINASTTAAGTLARGGVIQFQKFVDSSAGGFGTAEEAATAARQARRAAGTSDQWARWVTLQGSDGRFYLYQGSVVARATKPLGSGSPMHVFGAGFAEYYDGAASAWKAVGDTA